VWVIRPVGDRRGGRAWCWRPGRGRAPVACHVERAILGHRPQTGSGHPYCSGEHPRVWGPQRPGPHPGPGRGGAAHRGLGGAAIEGDPQGSTVVVAQEPPAGATVPPGSVVGLRTRTDIWPNGIAYPLRLWPGPARASDRIVAADPAQEALTVVLTMSPAVDLRIWLHTRQGRRVLVDSTAGLERCRPVNRSVRCRFAFGALGARSLGCGPSVSPGARLGRQRSRSRSPSPGRHPARSSARSALGPCRKGPYGLQRSPTVANG
jgi:hypothetical protein